MINTDTEESLLKIEIFFFLSHCIALAFILIIYSSFNTNRDPVVDFTADRRAQLSLHVLPRILAYNP